MDYNIVFKTIIFSISFVSIIALIVIAIVLDHWLQRIMLQIRNGFVLISNGLEEANKIAKQSLAHGIKNPEAAVSDAFGPKNSKNNQAVNTKSLMTRAALQGQKDNGALQNQKSNGPNA
jgi:hypothetical protein